ncbi:MAG: methylthioribulose 1-phosphate dehydratase [Actinomycetota bacterium]|nr:methylthioribulose 1-phosphate dehydratase [Actinomycetota bacterium]
MTDRETKELLCELLRAFYGRDWVSGTGGGICGPTQDGNMFLAPTGVHKERIVPDDFFVVDPQTCAVVHEPRNEGLRPSECNPIFSAAWRARGARSVMHSHALTAVMVADLAGDRDEIAIEGFEMLKGIRGLTNRDRHVLPVIRNTPREAELTDQVERALAGERFARVYCILVADHGAYIWGDDVWEAKRHTEVYHWLFQATLARAKHA